MKKKKVILSFDYELFFGDRSGTVQKTIIEPTYKILDAMEAIGFRGNFFIDWQMLKYLKCVNTERTNFDYLSIVTQLKDIVKRGHRIELHIHPHWVDARYNGDGTWDFSNFTHYCLSSFSEDEILRMLEEGVHLLTSIAREVEPEYRLCAFRAGGWAVQPFDKIRNALLNVNIRIDSSVMSGLGVKNEYYSVDFTKVPRLSKAYYRFFDDVCAENIDGDFLEIPISASPRPFIVRIIDYLFRVSKKTCNLLTDGTHERANEIPNTWINPSSLSVISFSTRHPIVVFLMQIFQKGDYTCYIDHPKDFSTYTCNSIKSLSHISTSVLYKDFFEFYFI